MILDGLPLELMREVLLDLPTVDIIQTVKCTRRLHHFAKTDKALGRRLQNRVFNVRLRLDNYVCKCRKSVLCLYLSGGLRRKIDVLARNGGNFYFWFEDKCKCHRRTLEIEPDLLNHPSFLYESHLRNFENGTSFAIKNDSLDDAVINCGKFFNILMKFCVIQEFQLDLHHSDDHKWDKMSAFFNANPPDLRIQPYVFINSRANLDNLSVFPNGLAGIQIFNHYGPILTDTYNEVFRRTPHVSISEMDPPYTYEDLVGLFKDTKRLSLRCVTNIAEEQLCQLVQHFYEVKHDEECLFEIGFVGGCLITDLLTLIPEEAYSLHLERSRIVDPEPEIRTWVEMTDKFGRRWALIVVITHSPWHLFHICSVKDFIDHRMIQLFKQFYPEHFDSDQFDFDQSDSDSDSDQL